MKTVAEQFRDEYYKSHVWERTSWLGHQVLKCPLDLWQYQELLCAHRPDVLIEAGTHAGGSALFFASVFDGLGHGEVWSIDVAARATPPHPRIRYLTGNTATPLITESMVAGLRVAVTLDSEHTPEHVERELESLDLLTSVGQFLVVEDTFEYELYGKPNDLRRVVMAFCERHPEFAEHPDANKFMATFNPGGVLVRSGCP